ncbi:MAG TPA: flagellar assembly protein FliW [Rhodocyclaceae bacterium]|jgi:flagellar assembly factor FliW|nr:flagellar assembly protein FliW [Rhodocyclaceae bacterium]
MSIKIKSSRYGEIEVAEDKVIEFPQGLAGFESLRRFAFLHPESDSPKYYILQSMEDADVAFNVADPAVFGFNYEITLDEALSAVLDQPDTPAAVADDAVLVILSKESDNAPLRAVLKAPLILNLKTRRGIQHTFTRLDYTL